MRLRVLWTMPILLQPYVPSKIKRLRLSARETPIRMHSLLRLRPRGPVLSGLVLAAAALATAGCGDDNVTTPDTPAPTSVTVLTTLPAEDAPPVYPSPA